MAILSPTGDPDTDKKLWWRCVFIAAAVQPVMLLLSLIFQTTVLLKILYIPLIMFFLFVFRIVIGNPPGNAEAAGASFSFLVFLVPVCFLLYSFILGTIFYLVYAISENDY